MKNIANKQHGNPSNSLNDGDLFTKMMDAMTEKELTDGLNELLENMTEENYDPALIDAYLAALDQKAPMPEVPDADTSFANFKSKLFLAAPAKNDRSAIPRRKTQSAWRVGLIAALTVVCLMSGMVVAQAAGVDVFGAIARWTEEVFSLGGIHSEGAEDRTSFPPLENNGTGGGADINYASLQDALDDYSITEFSEPTWVPEGYAFENVKVDCWPDGTFIGLFAEYSDGANSLHIDVVYYEDEANEQLQKADAPVETFVANGVTVYLIENINSNSAAWITEHYECYISGDVEMQVLKQIVLSTYTLMQ